MSNDFITATIYESIQLQKMLLKDTLFIQSIQKAIHMLNTAYNNGDKILVAGNGGSAADASHFATEMVVKYKQVRKGYPAIALNTDGSILTAQGNDFGFESLFSRQVEALGKAGDVFIGITTSGTSKNIFTAMQKAQEMGLKTIGLLGSGGTIHTLCDIAIRIPSDHVPRIQEIHTMIIHIISEELEKKFIQK